MRRVLLVLFWFILFSTFSSSYCQTRQNWRGQEDVVDFGQLKMNKNLLKGSRWAIDEMQKGNTISVYYAIEIVDISKVDVDTMSIRIEFHMRERWEANDDLEWPPGLFNASDKDDVFIRAPQEILSSIWSPDTFIPNARSTNIATLTDKKSVVNLFQNKTIIFKARMTAILGCAFNFQWYPLDEQICDLKLESYTLPSTFVSYEWEHLQEPVTLTDLKLLQYEMELPLHRGSGAETRWGRSELYPYVYLRLRFARQLGHHIIQVFVPTTLVVILSWFSFWLGLDAIPGRVSLLITCMLTIVTMHTTMKGAIPPVNYIKMMDIWMVGCIAFVFGALAEFIIVKYLSWKKAQELKAQGERKTAIEKYWKDLGIDSNAKPKQQAQASHPYLEFYGNLNAKEMMMKDGPHPMMNIPGLIQNNNVEFGENNALRQSQGRFDPSQIAIYGARQRQYNFRTPGACEYGPGSFGPTFAETKRPIWVVIDRVSRAAFPVVFLIFNLSYWPYLLIGASQQFSSMK